MVVPIHPPSPSVAGEGSHTHCQGRGPPHKQGCIPGSEIRVQGAKEEWETSASPTSTRCCESIRKGDLMLPTGIPSPFRPLHKHHLHKAFLEPCVENRTPAQAELLGTACVHQAGSHKFCRAVCVDVSVWMCVHKHAEARGQQEWFLRHCLPFVYEAEPLGLAH